jgi:magnesium chelatase family protein
MHSVSAAAEASERVASRVGQARRLQLERQCVTNARLSNRQVERFCRPTPQALALLDRASATLGLSARAYHRVLKVARTIADLSGTEMIEAQQVGEAMALRRLDRRTSG